MGPTTDKTSGQNHQSKDKSLRRNRHRGPTRWHAIKEESTVFNRDWVNQQACSLLKYINVLTNLFIMRNYFINCAERVLVPTIFFNLCTYVAIKLWFRKSLAQERFKSDMEFRYQIIVSAIQFRNFKNAWWAHRGST